MISRLGLAISRVFHRVCPDPFVIAILLTALTIGLALIFGKFGPGQGPAARSLALLDAWRGDDGFWKLLTFGMQMCLILVTGHALASTRPVRQLIQILADVPRRAGGAAVLVCLAASLTGLINWGLGLIVGALMAREVGRSMTRRNLPVHYPLLAAAGYMGLLVFHGGLSGSAPLSATTIEGAKKVLPEAAVALIGNGIPLDRTLFSPLNVFVTGGLVVILPLLFWMLTPRAAGEMLPMNDELRRDPAQMIEHAPSAAESTDGFTIPDRLDRARWVTAILALLLLAGFVRYVYARGFLSIQINEVNALMFALGLILHGSPKAYMQAVEDGARDCGAIIVQFPIYAGIMSLMKVSGMIEMMTDAFMKLGDARTLPAMSFVSATLVGLFVPSGGAQWGLQGPVALQASANAGIDPAAMLMSVAYGDELANMLQPFWALPLLAITGAKARDIVGYTAIAMLVAGVWMAIGLLLF